MHGYTTFITVLTQLLRLFTKTSTYTHITYNMMSLTNHYTASFE